MRASSFFGIICLLAVACGTDRESGEKNSEGYYPGSVGRIDQVLFVTDSAAWKKGVGKAVHKVFGSDFAVLPQPEPLFDIKYRPVETFQDLFKKYRNIVFVGITAPPYTKTLDYIKQLVGAEKFSKVRKEGTFTYFATHKVWAAPQQITFIMAPGIAELREGIRANSTTLIDHLQHFEDKELFDRIYNRQVNEDIVDTLERLYALRLHIPEPYQLAMAESHFAWIRKIDREIDLNIVIHTKPYHDKAEFKVDKIIERRNRVMGKYIEGELKNSYMKTDTIRPIAYKKADFGDYFAVETKGLWRLANEFMGGPFVNYTIYDEKNKRLLTLEGFVYAPGESKRKYIRELQIILKTLEVFEMSQANAN